jgi:hypothetical protein
MQTRLAVDFCVLFCFLALKLNAGASPQSLPRFSIDQWRPFPQLQVIRNP